MKAPTMTKPIPSTQTRTVELLTISTNTQVNVIDDLREEWDHPCLKRQIELRGMASDYP
jgi:hypothetical protein